jgi:hypothetical protein
MVSNGTEGPSEERLSSHRLPGTTPIPVQDEGKCLAVSLSHLKASTHKRLVKKKKEKEEEKEEEKERKRRRRGGRSGEEEGS